MSPDATDLLIRPARPDDAKTIGEIYVETWRTTYAGMLPDHVLVRMSEARHAVLWGHDIGDRSQLVRVAESNNRIVGFGSAGALRNAGAGQGEVYTLYVRPDAHGHGVGRKLILSLFEGLLARGYPSAVIYVVAANPSRFFYERLGGKRSIQRTERLWGANVAEFGYVWPDLKATLDAACGRT
ncbi:MAG: N-acetyltransferase family protein [Alphaproteobacteria bacterium]